MNRLTSRAADLLTRRLGRGAALSWQAERTQVPDWLAGALDLFCAFRLPPSPEEMMSRVQPFLQQTALTEIDDPLLEVLIDNWLHSVCFEAFVTWIAGSPRYSDHLTDAVLEQPPFRFTARGGIA